MSAGRKSSLLYDPKARSLFFQSVFGLVLILLIYLGFKNLFINYYDKFTSSKTFWDMMRNASQIEVLTTFGTWITGYESGKSSYWTALFVGLANTLIVAFVGIIIATLWGFVLGIFRLSNSFILRTFSTIYIETLRNIPLLLQIFFWQMIFRLISGGLKAKDAITIIPGLVYYNSDGLRAPYLDWQAGGEYVFWAVIIGLITAYLISRWAKSRQERTGKTFAVFPVILLVIIGLPALVYLITGKPLIVELPSEITTGPKLKQGGWESGKGMFIPVEMWALLIALSTYTASFIAEIVRAGILSVAKGQTEAYSALGIPGSVGLRKVIIPQALRVIIPPLTSQYLNLTKNSSLAASIGYPELVALYAGTALNQTGRAVEIILITILIYLTISLLTSFFMNWFNNRMKLVER